MKHQKKVAPAKDLLSIIKRNGIIFSLLFILVLSLPPRLWKLTSRPIAIVDEGANARGVVQTLNYSNFRPADFYWDGGQASLSYYPTIFIIKLFNIFDLLLALRLTSALLSLAALIPFFFIVKKYTNFVVAFGATVLLSYSYYFLQFSRVGWVNMQTVTLGLYLFWTIESIENNIKIWKIILAGLLAGIMLYTYRAGIIYIFGAAVFLWYVLQKKKDRIGELENLFLFFFFMTLVSLPWILTVVNNWNRFVLRANVVSIFSVSFPYHGFTNWASVFFYQYFATVISWIFMIPYSGGGIENPRYLPLVYPPISPFLVPFYFLGLASVFKKFKTYFHYILLFILGLVFGQILTNNPPNGARAFFLLPIIYFFIAQGINFLYKKKRHMKNRAYIFLGSCFVIALLDFLFYMYWMSWIKVM